MVAGRNDDVIAEALTMLAGAIGQALNVTAGNIEEDEFRAMGNFQRNNPPISLRESMNLTRHKHKVQFGTHMLEKKAENWWGNTVQRFDEEGIEELIKYCPYYNTANAERSKCLKFVNDLRLEIKKAISYQHISHFVELVNKIKIYDKDYRESVAHYKSMNDKKGKD
ncbi:uncharacterized protein LOC131659775 [Vicia villosa]|uniref:uncharacterized protein LOC131659775 n=1 Tax=Vicia villosa TaxID=3911 RepID=UPI00273CB8DF|nr:uncharacterized protein LOC131659775 [Vicia villosa]